MVLIFLIIGATLLSAVWGMVFQIQIVRGLLKKGTVPKWLADLVVLKPAGTSLPATPQKVAGKWVAPPGQGHTPEYLAKKEELSRKWGTLKGILGLRK